MSDLLQLKGVVAGYGRVEVLHSLDLRVGVGEIVTLIGANGAGKTTTLRAITGLLRPTRGEIWFAGERVDALAAHRLPAMGLSMSPEGRRIFSRMTVLENLEMGAYTRSDRAAVACDLERNLELFPRLRERLGQKGGTLSGGEQQMLAIARALMARPRLLLLDEPSLGLAPLLVAQIFRIVEEIQKTGVTVLLVEQNARQALAVADRAYVLETGRVSLSGPAAELLQDPRVREAYLGL